MFLSQATPPRATRSNASRCWRPVLLLLSAAAAAAPAAAASTADANALQARHRQERAACTSGAPNQDRATCLREADASYAEARKGGLGDGSAPYAANASQRCNPLPEPDRADCVARMKGQGTTSGSAAAGGISRELTTREVAPSNPPQPTASAPAAAAASKP